MKPSFTRYSIALGKHAGPAVIDQIMISGVNFLMGLYLARYLGMSAFGQYSLILIITLFTVEIQRTLITSPMIVFTEKYKNTGYLDSVGIVQSYGTLILTLLATTVIYISSNFTDKWQISDLWLPAALFIAGRLHQEYLRRNLFASYKPVDALVVDFISCLMVLAGIGLFDITVANVLYIFSVSYIIPIIIYRLFHRSITQLKNIKDTIHIHWKFGRWLLASSVTTYLSSDFLVLIASFLIGAKAAGIVKSSQYLMGGMIILFQAMENIVPSKLSFYKNKNDYMELKFYFYKTLLLVTGVSILYGIILFGFLDPVLKWINSGPYTEDHYRIAIGYFIFSILLSINYTFNYLLRVFEKTNIIFIASTITACISVIIGKSLIIDFNLFGVMIGFFIVQLTIMVIYVLQAIPLLRQAK